MIDKRFKLSSETVLQYQIMDNDTDLNESEVVDLLNKLYEENKQMKGEIIKLGVKWRVLSQKNDSLRYENEQLKEEIEPLKQKEEVLNKIWRTYLENYE